jgi:transposase-like protein
MTRPSPYVIELSDADRAELTARARAYTLPHHVVQRATIVLLAADGAENVAIADRLELSVATVSKWRKRFFEQRLAGLGERHRSGRPREFPPSGASRGGGTGLRAAHPGTAGSAGTARAAAGRADAVEGFG